MAQSVALAVLENLVHMSREDYPVGYVVVEAIVPDHVRILDHLHFLDFRVGGVMRERKAGDDWLASGKSAVLRVPSAVVKGEWNYLISPQHLDFDQIVVHDPVPIRFDERLFESK